MQEEMKRKIERLLKKLEAYLYKMYENKWDFCYKKAYRNLFQ